MKMINIKHKQETMSFGQAVLTGLGQDQGLFFPEKIKPLDDINGLLNGPRFERQLAVIRALAGESALTDLPEAVAAALDVPLKLHPVTDGVHCLELFHGPTLAFKDYGARFMAQCLKQLKGEHPVTILTATSGDTGAAVAQAFHQVPGVQAVILFPKGRISPEQQQLFTTLSGNIKTVAINGRFDDCQVLVKQCFDDKNLVASLGLNSANSINISRLLAQVTYYFDAVAALPEEQRDSLVFSVPCGNFGNLTAGLMAQALGLPVKRWVATTNNNDTVPRFWHSGQWQPKDTVATLSNAMDVSQPNNWVRIQHLLDQGVIDSSCLSAVAVDEVTTQEAMKFLHGQGYLSEPHAAVAYHGLKQSLAADEVGVFLGTAHPAKFKSSVDEVLSLDVPLPAVMQDAMKQTDRSIEMANDLNALKAQLKAWGRE